ncbi:MAG: hypothetical protein ACI8TF_001400 [Paracoccaceae bacterium]|jgi:hypothetical protein
MRSPWARVVAVADRQVSQIATLAPIQIRLVTDRHGGAYADPVGSGRGSSRTGLTDSDGGGTADIAGNGRRGW